MLAEGAVEIAACALRGWPNLGGVEGPARLSGDNTDALARAGWDHTAIDSAEKADRWPAAAPLAVVVVTLVAAGGSVAAWAARSHGETLWATSPALLVPLPIVVATTGSAAWWLAAHGHRRVALAMALMCGIESGYVLAVAGTLHYLRLAGSDGPVAYLLVAVQDVGPLAAVCALQNLLLVATGYLAGVSVGLRRWQRVLWLLPLIYLIVVLVSPGEPYEAYPFVEANSLAVDIVSFTVGAGCWIATVLISPVLVWRTMSRARGGTRRQLSVLGSCAVAPPVIVAICMIGIPLAQVADLMSPAVSLGFLWTAYGTAFVVAALGVPFAVDVHSLNRRPELVPRVVGVVVTVVVGTLCAMAVVALASTAGLLIGRDALLAAVVFASVLSALVAPLRTRITRSLLLAADPARARAAFLVGQITDDDRSRPAIAAQEIARLSLSDPNARLHLHPPGGSEWLDVEGRVVDPVPPAAIGEAAFCLDHDGPDADSDGVLAEIAPLLELAVMEAAVRAQSSLLAAEAARADRATDEARHRLERDLHDGVQGRLLALRLSLTMANRGIRDEGAKLVIDEAREGLQRALDELRALAAGATSERLSRHGLASALEEFTRGVPVPITLSIPGPRLSSATESVAYLVICEAVTNALKHAEADAIDVRVHTKDDVVSIVVTDDGRGGADLRGGTGLRGLDERVVPMGGRLVVSDRQPHGTVVEVVLPCGS